jgi:hypothetical protein
VIGNLVIQSIRALGNKCRSRWPAYPFAADMAMKSGRTG